MSASQLTACLILIGNELLSGRTRDLNMPYLAEKLNERGIRLLEARVIPDIEQTIIDTVNAVRPHFTYVFTTGGIGPTHDDITSESIAKAFGKPLILYPEAKKLLEHHYGADINEARMKMAHVPEGATLIPNPVSAAPGFRMDNVFVLPGVPRIMQAMVEALIHELATGKPMRSVTVSVYLQEGVIAKGLAEIQNRFPEVEIGSYPFIRQGKLGASLVMRSVNEAQLKQTHKELLAFLHSLNGEIAQDVA